MSFFKGDDTNQSFVIQQNNFLDPTQGNKKRRASVDWELESFGIGSNAPGGEVNWDEQTDCLDSSINTNYNGF